MRIVPVMACLAAMVAATPAATQPVRASEVSLRHQLRFTPDDPMTIANLASLYVRTGRTARAHRLYRGLLGLENVLLERADGPPVWSHQLAERALLVSTPRPTTVLSSR